MFISQPTNVDFLLDSVRFRLGDIDGSLYSTTFLRTAIIAGVRKLMSKWNSKYQIFGDSTRIVPQPIDIPAGWVYIATTHGNATIPDDRGDGTPYRTNDVFRNPFVAFTQSTGLFEQSDEEAVVLAAAVVTHVAKYTSSADTFVSFKTEDLSYSNLGGERARQELITTLSRELENLFRTRIASPAIQSISSIDSYYWGVQRYDR